MWGLRKPHNPDQALNPLLLLIVLLSRPSMAVACPALLHWLLQVLQVPVPDADSAMEHVEGTEEERTEEAERPIQRGVTATKAAAEKGPRVSARPSFTFWGTGYSDASRAAVSSLLPDSPRHGSGQASGGFFDLLADSASDGGTSAPLLHSAKLRALMAVQGSASARHASRCEFEHGYFTPRILTHCYMLINSPTPAITALPLPAPGTQPAVMLSAA